MGPGKEQENSILSVVCCVVCCACVVCLCACVCCVRVLCVCAPVCVCCVLCVLCVVCVCVVCCVCSGVGLGGLWGSFWELLLGTPFGTFPPRSRQIRKAWATLNLSDK